MNDLSAVPGEDGRWRFAPPPLDAARFREFCALVGDPNPVHVDPGFARGLGLPDAIAPGGLVVSALSRMLVGERVIELDVRLLVPVPAGTAIVCEGRTSGTTADGDTEVDCVVRDAEGTLFARAAAILGGSRTGDPLVVAR